MRIQASLLLAALGGASGHKIAVYPLQDSTIFGGEAETAKAVGSNTVGVTSNGVRRTLIQFDFSALPSDALVKKVSIDLDVQRSAGSPDISMFRVTTPWSAGTATGAEGSVAQNDDVTWKYSTYSTMPWKTEGGDYDSQVLSNEKGDLFLSTSVLESTVQDMIHGSIPNFGFILIGDEEGTPSFQTFGSMEESKRNHRPKLVIEYDSISTTPAVARKNLRKLQDSDGTDGTGVDSDAVAVDTDGTDGTDGVVVDSDGTGADSDGTDGVVVDSDGTGADSDGTDGVVVDSDGTGADSDGTDSTGGATGGAFCFSGESMVEVQGKGIVSIDTVQIGDFVKADTDAFAQVYSFGHFEKNVKAEYLQISATGLKTPLQMSADHMIFVQQGSATVSVPAESVKIGDMLLTTNGESAQVNNIKNVVKNGAFAPFTTNGKIVVNGAIASNYVSFMDGIPMQWIAHSFNAPHRMVCAINFSICENETYSNGMSSWIVAPLQAANMLMRQTAPVKAVGVAALMASLVVVNVIESMFLSPMLALACVVGYLMVKKSTAKAKVML